MDPRFALWLVIRCEVVCLTGFAVGFLIAPLLQMDRLLLACAFTAPLALVEIMRAAREVSREVSRKRQEQLPPDDP